MWQAFFLPATVPNKECEMAENYKTENGVELSLDVKKKVKKIADSYFDLAKKEIVVTSGTRSSQSQAEAMHTKLAGGDDLAVYSSQEAAQQIKKIYDEGVKNKSKKSDVIDKIKAEIDGQIEKGLYISMHLKKGAIDVRSRDMSNAQKEHFKAAAKDVAVTVILETTPPHFHLQF